MGIRFDIYYISVIYFWKGKNKKESKQGSRHKGFALALFKKEYTGCPILVAIVGYLGYY